MSKEKVDLLNKIKGLGYTVLEISKETNIPSSRMYKWFKGEGLPKVKDVQILSKWLMEKKGENVNLLSESTTEYKTKDQLIDSLHSQIKQLERIEQMQIDEITYLRSVLKQNGIRLSNRIDNDGSVRSKAS